MGYFASQGAALSLSMSREPGPRIPQIAAIYAAAAHCLSIKNSGPGIVVMPTGSGKTAVMIAVPFLVQPQRVLYVSPSRLVRDQIAEEVRSQRTLKYLGALPVGQPLPEVRCLSSFEDVADAAGELDSVDVVVVTPSLLGRPEALERLGSDAFDLVVFDEAHHMPASSWQRILEHFDQARVLLFTATPSRRDRKRVDGRLVFAYTVTQAFADRVFGEVKYAPVRPADGQSEDEAIAIAAADRLAQDRDQGFDHRLLVRTDSRKRADELAGVYESATALRLATVHSGYSYRHVKSVLKKLDEGTLDGLIAVDMLGEGVDFPKLKVAAIHSPHKSLGVTLQFVGRFARTTDNTVGCATFLSTPNGIRHEAVRLYSEDAVWQRLVPDLADKSVSDLLDLQSALDTFVPRPAPPSTDSAINEFSLYSVEPMAHVKLYQTGTAPDMAADVVLPAGFEVLWDEYSEELDCRTVVSLQSVQPSWTRAPEYARLDYDLHVLHYHSESGILFIASSRRQLAFYEALAESLTDGDHGIVSLSRLNAVISGLTAVECFSIGMRNRVRGASTESYRIMAGPHTERAVSETDGHLYHRGHVFLKGRRGDRDITIGYSSSAKVWSSEKLNIARLIEWCDSLGHLIAHPGASTTGSGLDRLQVGTPVDSLPPLLGAIWPEMAYTRTMWVGPALDSSESLLDTEFALEPRAADATSQRFDVVGSGGALASLEYAPGSTSRFADIGQGESDALSVFDSDGRTLGSLRQFLQNHPPSFFDFQFSRYEGSDCYREIRHLPQLNAEMLIPWDWAGVDPHVEVDVPLTAASVQGAVSRYLQDQGCEDVIFYDHRPGEAADFVAVKEEAERVLLTLVHCKSSGGADTGARVGDVYELAGQVAKSARFCGRPKEMLAHVRRRSQSGSVFVRGAMDQIESLLEGPKIVESEIWLVQPGLSKSSALTYEPVAMVLAACGDFVRRYDVRLTVVCAD